MTATINLRDYGIGLLDLGIPIRTSELVKPSDVIVMNSPIIAGRIEAIVMHPIDYAYAKFWNDPYAAHEEAQRWISDHIDAMARDATKRIDQMYREKDLPQYQTRSKEMRPA